MLLTRISFIILSISLFAAPLANADYLLKFTASSTAHDPTTSFGSNVNTWIRVSIVDSHPVDGPIRALNQSTRFA